MHICIYTCIYSFGKDIYDYIYICMHIYIYIDKGNSSPSSPFEASKVAKLCGLGSSWNGAVRGLVSNNKYFGIEGNTFLECSDLALV